MAIVGGLILVVIGIAALAAILLLELPGAFGTVDVAVPATGTVELDPGTAMVTAAAFVVLVGVIEAGRS
jgi:hypothetical protein